jgi:hypothetical protein
MKATRLRLKQMTATERRTPVSILPALRCKCDENKVTLRVLGWTSIAVGITALGLYVGRELRQRYKFNRRTPADFYSHAGDEAPSAEYGVGI